MTEVMISGIPVSFPFEPYDVQTRYMEKIIESLQNSTNAVLESPTGTGKTLSLLCSSIAWLLMKKAQVQLNAQAGGFNEPGSYFKSLQGNLKSSSGPKEAPSTWGMPKIIYASRTHSQLTQAMQELKRSHYRHIKATVLGSRDQMCIHPEVSKESSNQNKIFLCQAKVKSRTCFFYNNVESKKEDGSVKGDEILDIEDLVKTGKKLKCCPYYLSKELKNDADIVFMPYNYLLDPKARKANGVELQNNIIIFDEAHNIERMCEESASLQMKTTDIALCIDEVTHVMKSMSENSDEQMELSPDNNQPKDFTADDLCILKEILLAFEKAVDEIPISVGGDTTFPGEYIFELLARAEIHDGNQSTVCALVDNLVQYLSTAGGASPFQRKGVGLQKLSDLLQIVYSNTTNGHKERVKLCYKVHVCFEDKKSNKKTDSWSVLKTNSSRTTERVLSYWCFSPGFGMKQLLDQNVRSIILTSGTLAPLKPLISELGIPIHVKLENPHIVSGSQICVKIISQGPDAFTLNSNYQNRNDPKYISSLGRTILSFSRVVPDGLLVFFPSYPIMAKCQEEWQASGIWTSICNIKPIFVEPQRKDTFNTVMSDFYSKINDPSSKGACFMAVCRGKVSEGLDFADMNGRAVIITGLPFPPLKDPRIILKKKYLDELRLKNKEYLSGDDWYSLEASRAVNQAIGRVIRHKNDYGAILLCDSRFNNQKLKGQLSAWLKDHITPSKKFGESVGEVCRFFKNAERTLPLPKLKPLIVTELKFSSEAVVNASGVSFPSTNKRSISKVGLVQTSLKSYPNSNEVYGNFSMDFYTSSKPSAYAEEFRPTATKDLFSALDTSSQTQCQSISPLVGIHKRENDSDMSIEMINKKRKLKIKAFGFERAITKKPSKDEQVIAEELRKAPESLIEFVKLVKGSLHKDKYKDFQSAVSKYKSMSDYNNLISNLDELFLPNKDLLFLYRGMKRFLKEEHKPQFELHVDNFMA